MPQFDAVQYGRLLASVDHLTAALQETSARLVHLDARLAEVEGRFRVGKGVLIGMLFAAGGLGMAAREMISGLFGR